MTLLLLELLMGVLACEYGGGCRSSETPPFPSDDDPEFIDDVLDEDDSNACFDELCESVCGVSCDDIIFV